jgi:hypothetical protein
MIASTIRFLFLLGNLSYVFINYDKVSLYRSLHDLWSQFDNDCIYTKDGQRNIVDLTTGIFLIPKIVLFYIPQVCFRVVLIAVVTGLTIVFVDRNQFSRDKIGNYTIDACNSYKHYLENSPPESSQFLIQTIHFFFLLVMSLVLFIIYVFFVDCVSYCFTAIIKKKETLIPYQRKKKE